MNQFHFLRICPFFGLSSLAFLTLGCNQSTPDNSAKTSAVTAPSTSTNAKSKPSISSPIQLTDATREAGIVWKHNSGAFGLKLMPETMSGGVAWFDYDADGDADLFFVNGRYWTQKEVAQYQRGQWSNGEKTVWKRQNPPGTPPLRRVPARIPTQKTFGALYRNNGNGTFSDVTRGSGLEVSMQGMGAAAGDYNGDGREDLLVTSLGRNYLFANRSTAGAARFEEVAQSAGVASKGWSSSASWLDYDRDGRLDLFVCRYVDWTPANDRFGTMNGRDKSYTAPFFYVGQSNLLFRNVGGGRFQDVSSRSGITQSSTKGKALGVVVCDPNDDGWPDLAVANDSEPNLLLQNKRDGRFEEIGQRAGLALDSNGQDRAGMGISTADVDHSNRDSIAIGNFDAEMMGYYINTGKGNFTDIGPITEIGRASRTFSIFGCEFFDADNDSWPDLLAASGHIDPQIDGIRGTSYALRPLFFWNKGRGEFFEVGQSAGSSLQSPRVGRGLAMADYDLDGDVDAVMTTNNGAPVLWRNDAAQRTSTAKNASIRLTLRGAKGNRSAIGAVVKVKIAERDGLRRWVRSGSSYLSQGELPVTLGLGQSKKVPLISVRWPSGVTTRLRDVAVNQAIEIDESKGLIRRSPLKSVQVLAE